MERLTLTQTKDLRISSVFTQDVAKYGKYVYAIGSRC